MSQGSNLKMAGIEFLHRLHTMTSHNNNNLIIMDGVDADLYLIGSSIASQDSGLMRTYHNVTVSVPVQLFDYPTILPEWVLL